MRLFNQHYRQKNPSRRTALGGEKKSLHSEMMRALNKPRKNPDRPFSYKLALQHDEARERMKRRDASAVEAFNLLGELNTLVESGFTQFIPLRDVVAADIEGYLAEGQAHLQLEEALRDLKKKDVLVLQEQLNQAHYADLAAGTSSRSRRLRQRHEQREDVKAARQKARVLESKRGRLEDQMREWLRRSKVSDVAFLVGEDRLKGMKDMSKAAREELGAEIGAYIPADPKLWKRVERALESRYKNRYVPPSLKSVKQAEMEALSRIATLKQQEKASSNLSERKALRKKREKIEARLAKAAAARWRSKVVLAYEDAGGREFIGKKVGAKKFKNFDEPYPLGDGLFGVISEKGSGQYRWFLTDGSQVHMSDKVADLRTASRQTKIAKRAFVDLLTVGGMTDDAGDSLAGWDNIEDKNRRWLEDNKPDISPAIARMLLNNIGDRHMPDRKTATWLVKSSKLKEEDLQKKQPKVTRRTGVKNMTAGEVREFPGRNKKYKIRVRRSTDGFRTTVDAKSGSKKVFFTKKASEVLPKAHVLGGLLTGAEQVSEAISNPSKLKRMHTTAKRNLAKREKRRGRKKNPEAPRVKAGTADIKSLASLYAIPDDAEEAFKLGLYFGIMRGIDTCGVQNYFERKRIRKKFAEQLMRGAFETAAEAGGVSPPKSRKTSGRKRPKGLSALLADIDIDDDEDEDDEG